MTGSTATPTYGARFFDELRQLTNSTFGFAFADIAALRAMTREQVLEAVSNRVDVPWILQLESSSPEEFARAIVRERGVRAAQETDREFILTVLTAVLPLR